jgi:pantoate--beta-alanine ligase
MGALHEGHLALVRRARQNADRVVVSIFVNPLQFDDPRDLERYPRDFANDTRLLESAGASLAFTGTLEQFFPPAQGGVRRIDPGPCAQGLEGALRPGHFEGVATIVERLFEIVEPHEATFGQKDFQQTLVVRDLARRRGAPRIFVAPTVREPEGLAMSSRNVFLKPEERTRALAIHAALRAAHGLYQGGVRDAGTLGAFLRGALSKAQLEVQYATVRDPEVWTAEEPKGDLARAVALIAVKLGSVRLIDNWVLSSPDGGL